MRCECCTGTCCCERWLRGRTWLSGIFLVRPICVCVCEMKKVFVPRRKTLWSFTPRLTLLTVTVSPRTTSQLEASFIFYTRLILYRHSHFLWHSFSTTSCRKGHWWSLIEAAFTDSNLPKLYSVKACCFIAELFRKRVILSGRLKLQL